MDRDTELKINYSDMANLVERFKETRPRVDGNWFLVERRDEPSRVVIMDDLETFSFRRAGYIVTPVIVLRKNEIENHEKNSNDS